MNATTHQSTGNSIAMASRASIGKCHWAPLAAVAISIVCANASYAQTCPADLTALASQIQTPGLQARLSLPMATLVENAGGVDQAIARTQAALEDVQARRVVAVENGRSTQALDDAILVFTKQIEALQCLKG